MGTETPVLYSGASLSAFKATHGSATRQTSAGLEISDSVEPTWHLLSLDDPAFAYRRLDVRVTATPAPECDTCLYFNHMGGVDLLSVNSSGEIIAQGPILNAAVTRDEAGRVIIDLSFSSSSSRLFIGTSSGTGAPLYVGTGAPQWTILEVAIASLPLLTADQDPIVLVDVGAAGGIDEVWGPLLPRLHCVLVEPDPAAAEALRDFVQAWPAAQVLDVALWDADEERTLYVTRYGLCSSLLEPDKDVLANYAVAPCFEVVKHTTVKCRRYDGIPGAPAPDVIKMDVQGAEYEVLSGFGQHLDKVLAIELESHFYAIYKEQKLIGDIVSMLAARGLRLRKLNPQYNFDRDYLEVNAYFTREGDLTLTQSRKLELIHKQLGLPLHETGRRLVAQALG